MLAPLAPKEATGVPWLGMAQPPPLLSAYHPHKAFHNLQPPWRGRGREREGERERENLVLGLEEKEWRGGGFKEW